MVKGKRKCYYPYHIISSVCMMSLPCLVLPYSIGVNETTNVVPSRPYDSRLPDFGMTVNSASESVVNEAVNGVKLFDLFVSLNVTLVVLWRAELMQITSSSRGSVASNVIRNL